MSLNASFVKSIVDIKNKLSEYPTLFIIGRSNVGKSTFINTFCNRTSLARVSQSPGKTITMNYYLVNNSHYLLDSPGFGYAKRSKIQTLQFKSMLSSFIQNNTYQKTILLIDAKIGPTSDDLEYYNFLKQNNHNLVIICTKFDKLNSSEKILNKRKIDEIFKGFSVIYYSKDKKDMINDLRTKILSS